MCIVEGDKVAITGFDGKNTPSYESEWIVKRILASQKPIFILHGALTDDLSRALLQELDNTHASRHEAELVIEDATRIFCHSKVIQRLRAEGLEIRVRNPIRILALTANPYTPEYQCSSQQLLECLAMTLPDPCPPIIDVISGYSYS